MPRRSLRPPLKPVKIPLNLIQFTGFNSGWRGIRHRSILAIVQALQVFQQTPPCISMAVFFHNRIYKIPSSAEMKIVFGDKTYL